MAKEETVWPMGALPKLSVQGTPCSQRLPLVCRSTTMPLPAIANERTLLSMLTGEPALVCS